MEIPLKCQCGKIRGTVANAGPKRGCRLVCYCDDCQKYANHLGSEGVLDELGGTDIYQTTPAQVTITEGADELKCLRLTEKGMYRWYSACCTTPLANTMASPKAPFVGIVHTFMDHEGHGATRDESLGQPAAYTQGKYAIGGVPAHAHATVSLPVVFGFMRRFLLGALKQEHKPSPFFVNGQPITPPEVLAR